MGERNPSGESRSTVSGRHGAYFRVLEALEGPGCPLCLLRSSAVERYLDSLLYEQVNDPDLRQALARSRGFCREHAYVLVGLGDSLGTAILYRDQVGQALEAVRIARRRAGSTPPRPRWFPNGVQREDPASVLARMVKPEGPCPACRVAEEAEDRYLSSLLQHVDSPEIRRAVERSSFLCLPHLTAALQRADSPDLARVLLEVAEAKLARLQHDLSELIRKRDYRFAHEPRGEEQTAWFRAVWHLVGWPRSRIGHGPGRIPGQGRGA